MLCVSSVAIEARLYFRQFGVGSVPWSRSPPGQPAGSRPMVIAPTRARICNPSNLLYIHRPWMRKTMDGSRSRLTSKGPRVTAPALRRNAGDERGIIVAILIPDGIVAPVGSGADPEDRIEIGPAYPDLSGWHLAFRPVSRRHGRLRGVLLQAP